MRSPPRIPSLTLPRSDKPFVGGTATSVLFHGALLALIAWGGDRASDELLRTAGGPGEPGGGGGGGGERIEYIELPPYVPPSSASSAAETVVRREVEFEVPKPQLRNIPSEAQRVRFLPPTDRMAAPRLGSGPGYGGGPGSGTGSGGGSGTEQGTGIGSGQGPGTGGGGGDGYGPQLQQALMPPTDWPESVRGQEFKVRFWIDEGGRVDRVEVEPQIADSDYRKKFLDKMKQYVFAPARRADGTPVAAPFEAWITF